MASRVLLAAFAIVALCQCKRAAPEITPSADASPPVSTAARHPVLDAKEYCRILERAGDSIDHDLQLAALNPRTTPQQAREVLASASINGQRPRVMVMAKEEGFDEDDVTEFIKTHHDEVAPCAEKFMRRVESETNVVDRLKAIASLDQAKH